VAFDLDYASLARFAGGADAGVPVKAPEKGAVYLSRDLASRLELTEGEVVGLKLGEGWKFYVVERILAPSGLAGYGHEIERPVFDVFLPPGELEAVPAVTEVLINLGIGEDADPAFARRVSEDSTNLLKPLFDELAQRGSRPLIRYWKADLLASAASIGKVQVASLLQLSSFAIVASSALLATLVYLVLASRRRIVGVMRALGARRGEIVSISSLASLSLSLPGIVSGVVLGALVGRFAYGFASAAVGEILGSFNPKMEVPVDAMVLIVVGAVSVASVTAVVVSALQMTAYPAELIGGRERPLALPTLLVLVAGPTLIVFGAAAAGVDLRTNQPTFSYLGLPIAAGGLVILSLPTRWRRHVGGVWGLFTVAWIAYVDIARGHRLAEWFFRSLPFFVAAALVSGSIAAITGGLGILDAAVRRILAAAGARILALPSALRSASEHRASVWLVAQTTAAVICVLAMVSGLFALESAEGARFERELLGDWDGVVAFGTPPKEGAEAVLAEHKDLLPVDNVAELTATSGFVRVVAGGRAETRIYAVSEEVALGLEGKGFLPLKGRNGALASDADAWRSLSSRSPNGRPWAIMTEGAVSLGLVSPASAQLVHVDSDTVLDLAGLAPANSLLPGIYVSPETFSLLARGTKSSVALFEIPEAIPDPSGAASRLQGALLDYRAKVSFASEEVARRLKVRKMAASMLQSVLYLGVAVALVAQAAMVTRAVRARLRSLAVMRALGATRGLLVRSVLIEAAVLAVVGAGTGAVVGSLIAVRLYGLQGGTGSAAVLSATGLTFGGVVLAAMLASLWPALVAGTARPATVLRLPEE
jgi:ABC-type antimicrobial peptide transport system permease subunit